MTITVPAGPLHGTLAVPASKSATHRALIAATLSDRPTRLSSVLRCDDTEATAGALNALGAQIRFLSDEAVVMPLADPPLTAALDCRESGSTARFLLPLAAHLCREATLTGRGRLPQRPFAPLTEALRRAGTRVSADWLPLTVSGGLHPGRYLLDGSVSSQFVTALLLSLPLLAGDSELNFSAPLASAPYVEMTRATLAAFGVTVTGDAGGYQIPGGQRYHSPGVLRVEGDWSSAAFFLVAGALSPTGVTLTGLDSASPQGDRRMLELLRACGAAVTETPQAVTVRQGAFSGGTLRFDVSDVPDLVPVLSVAAAARPGVTEITGAARLRDKESDRLAATAAFLRALGGEVSVTPDGLCITGGKPLCGGRVDGAGDHRIVMAAAVAAALCKAPVEIGGAEAVVKSYPDFFRDRGALA